MFEFNSKTAVNKEFKIREIFKMIKAGKSLKDNANSIERILLSNVLSEQTLNIKSDDSCREIYVFNIVLKEKQIPTDFIKEFDKFIELHTYFIFQYEDEVKEICIYRFIEDKNIKRIKLYESEWMEKEFKELPHCMSIKEVYDNLIFDLLPIKVRDNEDINSFIERYNNIEKIKKEISSLEKKAFKESQSKKKFEIGRLLRNKRENLHKLVCYTANYFI